MKYLFKRKNPDGTETEIEAKKERWCWCALYKDGTGIEQFDTVNGKFHQIGEIEQDKLQLAALYKDGDEKRNIIIPWKDGMKLIHKYINVHSAIQHENINETARVYVWGYKMGEQKHFAYILPNDEIIFSPEDDIDLTNFKLK